MWVFCLLLISLMGANGLDSFPKRFVAAKKKNTFTLPCGVTSKEDATWTFNDENVVQKAGSNLVIDGVGMPSVGNYTCSNGVESVSTYLLLQDEDERDFDSFLTCRAKSYNCTISCEWKDPKYKLVRLGLGHHCLEGNKSCSWEMGDGRLHFELTHKVSPFSEERDMLELTAQAITNYTLLKKTKRFYLRDIIQPDHPQIVKCQKKNGKVNLIIDPPCTWSAPGSFFPLEHEVKYKRTSGGQEMNVPPCSSPCPLNLPTRISKWNLKVRSRDLLVKSNWGKWTDWKIVTCS
ncbi:interleukin-12 subunit beta isoform X2 [Vanacampus margaritifer]